MTQHAPNPRPVVLCILDGWGDRDDADNNAIALARTPNWDRLTARYPTGRLDASALDVGLPAGQMGNSEVGHMNLGAGRVVMQELPRIDAALADGSLADNAALADFIAKLRRSGGRAHVMGLLSPGGVHSHQDHMAALVGLLAKAGIAVRIHAFLDGRDTPPKSAAGFVDKFSADIDGLADTAFATVSGRYYAMDRDRRWDRVQRAYQAMVAGDGTTAPDAKAAIAAAYEREESDEFVVPTVIGDYAGMADGDGVLMINFRADRAREILAALADPAFDGFARRPVAFAASCGMVQYSSTHAAYMTALFPPQSLNNLLGEVVSRAGKTQLRIAETEKYAHVTFFFNGGREEVFEGEDRILVPSPKVATYDLQPEMSAPEVTDRLVAAIGAGSYDLIVVNYANPDMVGHTGILPAAITAVETIDTCLGRLAEAVETAGGAMLVTADHGNCEQMHDPNDNQPHTAHTLNPVPTLLVGAPHVAGLKPGRLCDVAPTLLTLLGLPQPAEMTGQPLIVEAKPHDARRAIA